jgi:hypothetical protein
MNVVHRFARGLSRHTDTSPQYRAAVQGPGQRLRHGFGQDGRSRPTRTNTRRQRITNDQETQWTIGITAAATAHSRLYQRSFALVVCDFVRIV